MKDLSNLQRLHLVNATQTYEAYRLAAHHADTYRDGIKWKRVNGRDYLIRGERSLGPRSEKTEEIYHAFIAGRDEAKARLSTSVERMQEQAAINKALKIGRAPEIVAKMLRKLDGVRAIDDFIVIGTHSLYAYEAMAGVQFISELLASGDVDLLYDGRKKLSLVSQKMDGHGLIGLLRQVDKTFEPVIHGGFRAYNADNFMVDLVSQPLGMKNGSKKTFSENDLVACEAPGLQWLCNAPKENTVAIDERGFPFPMRVVDPRVFALHKAWLSTQPTRDPVKKPRDLAQAIEVARMVVGKLPHLSFHETIQSLHGDVREAIKLLQLDVNHPAPKPRFRG